MAESTYEKLLGTLNRLQLRDLSRVASTNSNVAVGNELPKQVVTASVGKREYTEMVKMVKIKVSLNELDMPSGTKVTENQFYIEIDTPPVEPLNRERLNVVVPRILRRDMLKKEHQAALYDTPTFNTIQSVTYDVAYKTDENMLVCAPTGAGKTLIAVLCILRELTHYESIAEMKTSPFKIVYIAPMKALAAEIVNNLKKRLESLDISVKEFTGDMHLYAEEIGDTDVLVTTPEKWDTVTRKDTGENSLFRSVRLMIIDEAHLLHGDRGPVLEAIVARTFQVTEASCARLRVIGLSASLPNYKDIAEFLHVRPEIGLFYFNWGFRPVPLRQTFIGTKNNKWKRHFNIMDDVCYEKTLSFVKKNQQVLIFVHSRANTIGTALHILKCAEQEGDAHYFKPLQNLAYYNGVDLLKTSKLKTLKNLYDSGLGFHHAGMLRDDRQIVEQLFAKGLIKVLVSTATLAWGVNLPAHAVIIKGTQMYSPNKSTRVDIDLLDVQQMFGRAGRPQFDSTGEAVVISNQLQLPLYLSLLTWQTPIKSNLPESLADHLNAEIALGTVTCILDGVKWLKHTFLYVCMKKRPLAYKVKNDDIDARCIELIMNNAWTLHNANMIIYDTERNTLQSTEIGRIASHTYIHHETIRIISSNIETCIDLQSLLLMVSKAKEFEQVKERVEERVELTQLKKTGCRYFQSIVAQTAGKIVVLLQVHMSRGEINTTALYLDQIFIVRNTIRILRAVFDIAVSKQLANVAQVTLIFQKCLEHQCWPDDHLVRQMKRLNDSYHAIIKQGRFTLQQLRSITPEILGKLSGKHKEQMRLIHQWSKSVPLIHVDVAAYRLTPDFVRIDFDVTPDFKWKKNVNHEMFEPFIAWVENPDTHYIYKVWRFTVQRLQAERNDQLHIQMNVMIKENDILPEHLLLHIESLYWLGVLFQQKLERILFMETKAEYPASKAQERVDLSALQLLEDTESDDDSVCADGWDSELTDETSGTDSIGVAGTSRHPLGK